MQNTDVLIIGGGQSGLVMSRSLSALGVDHLVLERGRVGERWHSERWKSLHLLTTNALSALPGLAHGATNPEGFMPASSFARYLGAYQDRIAAPVLANTEIRQLDMIFGGYRAMTSSGEIRASAVVAATGACGTAFRPPAARAISSRIFQITPQQYTEPAQLPEGGVLVVGASSSGLQLAEEIHASGRPVMLSVGNHTRVPRRYRGKDIYAWMDATGMLDEAVSENGNVHAARRQPSLQLVGSPDNRNLDLGVVNQKGIRLLGRLSAADGLKVQFDASLESTTAASEIRMLRVLDRIDATIDALKLDAPPPDPAARQPIRFRQPALELDLQKAGICTIVWATGYAPHYPWLGASFLDSDGEIRNRGGVGAAPGLYLIGANFMRRRRSAFIDGCSRDADDLAPIIKSRLGQMARNVA